MQKNTQERSSTSPRHFKQITHSMRQYIERWRKQKVPCKEIAQRLEVHRSTIYRELKRGQVTHINSQLEQYTTYSADFAADRHDENMTAKGPALKIGADHNLIQRFNDLILNHKYSLYAARAYLIIKLAIINRTIPRPPRHMRCCPSQRIFGRLPVRAGAASYVFSPSSPACPCIWQAPPCEVPS